MHRLRVTPGATGLLLIVIMILAPVSSPYGLIGEAQAVQGCVSTCPDLVIRSIGVPNNLTATLPPKTQFNVTIANIGNASATNFNFRCKVNGTLVYNDTLSGFLYPGGGIGKFFNWTAPNAGSFTMTCSVNDVPPIINEWNYANNMKTTPPFLVKPAPIAHFLIQAQYQSWNIGPGENATYPLNVTRTGGIIENVTLSLDNVLPPAPANTVRAQLGVHGCFSAIQLGIYGCFSKNNQRMNFSTVLTITTNVTLTDGAYRLTILGKSPHALGPVYLILILNVGVPITLPSVLVYIPGHSVNTTVITGLHGYLNMTVSAQSSTAQYFIFSYGTKTCKSPCSFILNGGSNVPSTSASLSINTTNAPPEIYEISISLYSLDYKFSNRTSFDLFPCSYTDFCAVPTSRAYPIPGPGENIPIIVMTNPQMVNITVNVTLSMTPFADRLPNVKVYFQATGLRSNETSCVSWRESNCWVLVKPRVSVTVLMKFGGTNNKVGTFSVNLMATAPSYPTHLEPVWIVVTATPIATLPFSSFVSALATILLLASVSRKAKLNARRGTHQNQD